MLLIKVVWWKYSYYVPRHCWIGMSNREWITSLIREHWMVDLIFPIAIRGLQDSARIISSLMLKFTGSISMVAMLLPTWEWVVVVQILSSFARHDIYIVYQLVSCLTSLGFFADVDGRWTWEVPVSLQWVHKEKYRCWWHGGDVQESSCCHSCRSLSKEDWEAASKWAQEVWFIPTLFLSLS